jgi:hypothetical protein
MNEHFLAFQNIVNMTKAAPGTVLIILFIVRANNLLVDSVYFSFMYATVQHFDTIIIRNISDEHYTFSTKEK